MATHDFEPTHFQVTIGSHEPVLRVASGDTVRTWCVRGDVRTKAGVDIGNVHDPAYAAVAKIAKRLLP